MAVLRAFWVVVLACAATSLAQVNPGPTPVLPARPPVQPATTGPQEMVRLQFPNSDVQDVLRLYESLTGKRVIMDNLVQGKVNIFLTKDVTRDEAIKIIEMNLSLNGYSLVDADKDIVEVVGQNQNPRKAAVPIISDTADIPPGNTVVTFLFRLRYTDPQDVAAFLAQYLGGTTSIAAIPLPKSSSLLVTQSADSIRRIAHIVEQVDVEPAEVTSEFIPLYRADASKVVDMLKDILEKGGDQSRGGIGGPNVPGNIRNVRPVPNPVGGPAAQVDYDLGGLSGLSEESIVVGKIKISADVRTNRIHVITRPINLPFIRKLIEQFDANVEFAKPVTRPLRYISAADVFPVLLQALSEPGQEQQGGAGGTPGPQAGPTPQRVSATNPSGTNPYSPGQSTTASSSTLTVSEELSTQPVDTAPKSATIGNSKLIADVRANAIIVLGNREVVVKVAKILDEMDVKAPQVALSTVIGELTLNNDEEFGVDWFLKYDRKVVGTSINVPQTTVPIPFASASPAASPGGSPGVGGILDPAGLVNFANVLRNVGSGTNIYVAAGNYFSAIVHAMESTGRFRVISRPMVFTSNNKKAIIANGQEIPVPVNTLSNAQVNNVAAVQSSIEYKKVALQLEVVPLINSEKEVSLDILQKIDSVVPGSNVNIGGNSVPTIATRYIRTNVSAPNCATIVLGGLIQDNKAVSKSGIPYLSKLPVVGPLFRMTTHNRDRTELIILMRPEVTLTKLDLYRLRQKSEDRTHFGPELEHEDCPDCPKPGDGKQLPPPDVPSAKG
jgi:Type II secretory pathway, component PulD